MLSIAIFMSERLGVDRKNRKNAKYGQENDLVVKAFH